MTYQGNYSSSFGLGNWPSTTGYSTTTPVVLVCDKCGVQSCNTKGTSFEICNSCDIKLCRDCGPLPNECSTTCATGGCNSTLCGKEYGGSNFQMVRRQVPKCQDCNNDVLYCQRCLTKQTCNIRNLSPNKPGYQFSTQPGCGAYTCSHCNITVTSCGQNCISMRTSGYEECRLRTCNRCERPDVCTTRCSNPYCSETPCSSGIAVSWYRCKKIGCNKMQCSFEDPQRSCQECAAAERKVKNAAERQVQAAYKGWKTREANIKRDKEQAAAREKWQAKQFMCSPTPAEKATKVKEDTEKRRQAAIKGWKTREANKKRDKEQAAAREKWQAKQFMSYSAATLLTADKPNLSFKDEMTKRLTALYTACAPSKLFTVTKVINKYDGNFETLSLKLAKIYPENWVHVVPDVLCLSW